MAATDITEDKKQNPLIENLPSPASSTAGMQTTPAAAKEGKPGAAGSIMDGLENGANPVPGGIARSMAVAGQAQTDAPQSIADISQPNGQAQVQRGFQAPAAAPAVAPDAQPVAGRSIMDGLPSGSKPGTVMINGIPHMDLPNQKFPGPFEMAGDAISGTAKYVSSAPFDASKRLEQNRAGLVDATPQPTSSPQPNSAPNPISENIPIANGIDASSMNSEQRFKAADAYRSAVDKATGTNSAGDHGIAGLTKRFDAYAKNDDVRAMRNAREDLLGSGIQFNKDANGRLLIDNSGKFDPIAAAQGSPINMKEGNDIMARENQIRGQMIDSMNKANGIGQGIAAPPGEFVHQGMAETNKWNDRVTNDIAVREMKNPNMTRTARTELGKVMDTMLAGQNQQALEKMRQQGIMAGLGVQMRGQDIAAANDAARQGIEGQKIAIDAPYRAAQAEGQVQSNKSAALMAGLNQRAMNGDAKAVETLRALNGKDKFTAHVVGGGQNEAGLTLPQSLAVTGPDGSVTYHSPGGNSGASNAAAKIKADMQSGKLSRDDAIKQLKAMGYQ